MNVLSRALLCLLVALLPLPGAAAQAREVTGLQTFTLDNGLEVFVGETVD